MCIRIDSLVEQNVLQVLTGRPYLQDTRETQLPSSCPHSSHPTCASHMSHFAGCLVARYLRKLFSLQLLESSHSFSITQPLQSNPTINSGYKRLNRITIKFGTELKPTKQVVVNHNFIISPFGYSMTKPLKQTLNLNMSLGTVAKLTHT